MSPEEIEAGLPAAHAEMSERVVESGWALFIADGPSAGKIAGDGECSQTSSANDFFEHDDDGSWRKFLLRMNQCTAFRVGRYRIVEVKE